MLEYVEYFLEFAIPVLTVIVTILLFTLRFAQKKLADKQKELAESNKALAEAQQRLALAQTDLAVVQKRVEEFKQKSVVESEKHYHEMVERFESKFNAYLDYFSQIHLAGARDAGALSPANLLNSNYFNNQLSLFDLRKTHYSAEKKRLCRIFVNTLLQSDIFNDNKRVILLIDSGSTVFSIFGLLCDYYWNKSFTDKLKKIEIVTNNLPGMSVLIQRGRIGSSANSEMLFQCRALPGFLEGKYSATLGKESIVHLKCVIEELKNKYKDEGCTIVSAISGNYISLDDGLLWRGRYHGSMKVAMVNFSDKVFILSPLGKIFDMTVGKINTALKTSKNREWIEKEYQTLKRVEPVEDVVDWKELSDDACKIKKFLPSILLKNLDEIHLITTSRNELAWRSYPNGLYNHFHNIIIKLKQEFGTTLISESFHPGTESEQVAYELNKYRDDPQCAYYNYEFPHNEVREQMILLHRQSN